MTTTDGLACADILNNIARYLDGELDASACEAIVRHCDGCAACARTVDGLRDTIGLCRKAAGAPLPDDVRVRAQAAVRALLAQR